MFDFLLFAFVGFFLLYIVGDAIYRVFIIDFIADVPPYVFDVCLWISFFWLGWYLLHKFSR